MINDRSGPLYTGTADTGLPEAIDMHDGYRVANDARFVSHIAACPVDMVSATITRMHDLMVLEAGVRTIERFDDFVIGTGDPRFAKMRPMLAEVEPTLLPWLDDQPGEGIVVISTAHMAR